MFKVICRKQDSIFAMSTERKRAISRMNGNSDKLASHLIKCVIYDDSLSCLNHWISEICEYLAIANDFRIKPAGKKLKPNDYMDSIFSAFGDDIVDASINARQFRLDNDHKMDPYPDFEVTDRLVICIFETFQNIIKNFIPILTSNNHMSSKDFEPIVRKSIVFYTE